MQDHTHVRKGSARAGALLLAMTMLVGTIVTPALGETEPLDGQGGPVAEALTGLEAPIGSELEDPADPHLEAPIETHVEDPADPDLEAPIEPDLEAPADPADPVALRSAPAEEAEGLDLPETRVAIDGWDHVKPWDGNGAEHLPCGGAEHWILSPTGAGGLINYNITRASVFIDDVGYPMNRVGQGFGAYHADTDVGFDGTQSVEVKYDFDSSGRLGTGQAKDRPFLKLSHCDEFVVPPGTVTITLQKEWFDVEGNLIEEPSPLGWAIELFVGADEQASAWLPGDDNTVAMDLLVDHETGEDAAARYGVQESSEGGGFAVVDCGSLESANGIDRVNSGTGPFGAFDSGTHLVCNQQVPDGEAEPGTLRVTKSVTGEDAPAWYTLFKFRVDCGEGPSWFFLRNGRSWSDTVDAGAECTVTELWTRGAQQVLHKVDGGDWIVGTSTTVDIPTDATRGVRFLNSYDPPTIPVGLYKLWLDADGDVIHEDTPDADFTLTLSVDDGVLATLDQDDDPPSVWVDLEPGTSYAVAETNLADGWRTVPCPEFDEEAGAGEYSGTGTFELTDGGRHFVCNQRIPTPPPGPTPIPTPTPTPTTVDLNLHKVWLDVDGSALADPPMVGLEITLTVDGEVIATIDEDTARAGESSELDPGTTYVVAESVVPDGWEVATCPATLHGPGSGVVAHGIGSFDAEASGDHIVCNQPTVEVAPIVIERPEPTPVATPEPVTGPAPEPDPEPVAEPEVEVLGVTEELPRTGIRSTSMLWAAAILMLLGTATLMTTLKQYPIDRR